MNARNLFTFHQESDISILVGTPFGFPPPHILKTGKMKLTHIAASTCMKNHPLDDSTFVFHKIPNNIFSVSANFGVDTSEIQLFTLFVDRN